MQPGSALLCACYFHMGGHKEFDSGIGRCEILYAAGGINAWEDQKPWCLELTAVTFLALHRYQRYNILSSGKRRKDWTDELQTNIKADFTNNVSAFVSPWYVLEFPVISTRDSRGIPRQQPGIH